MRFHPPLVTPGTESRWLLSAAFAPSAARDPAAVQPGEVLRLGILLDLLPRCAALIGRQALEKELGAETGEVFWAAHCHTAAWSEHLASWSRRIAALAAEREVRVVLLKHTALRAAGVLRPGSRWASDLDILADRSRVAELSALLEGLGFERKAVRRTEHQLPPLVNAQAGVTVEIHTCLPGLRPPGRRTFATIDDLAARALLQAVDELPASCFLPDRGVLVAHAIGHGLAHHGLEPREYPLARMFADLIDLGGDSAQRAALIRGAIPWLERDLPGDEMEGVIEACERLERGDLDGLDDRADESPGARLLRHMLAGATDDAYAQALKPVAVLRRPSERARPVAVLAALWNDLALTRGQIEELYGRPRGAIGCWGWRVYRPFDLGRQILRGVIASSRLRGSARRAI